MALATGIRRSALSNKKHDPINPEHYTDGGIECIDYIRSKLTPEEFRGAIKFNAIKYLSRERLKGGDTDLRKAAWYLHYYLGGAECAVHCATAERAAAGKKTTSSSRSRRRDKRRRG